MFHGTLSFQELLPILIVLVILMLAAFVLVMSHRSYGRQLDLVESTDPSGSLLGSLVESSDGPAAPRFVKGEPVAYVSRQNGYGVPPVRTGTFLNFDKSGRARVDMGGHVVRRQPHLLCSR